jgi:protein SCO1
MNALWRPAALLVAGALFTSALPANAAQALPAGSLYDEAFRWTDDSGARVELAELRGRPVVVTMFYCNCSTTCMNTLSKLQEIETKFEQRHVTAEFVLVSYDSSLDTPRELSRFRERHKIPRPHWHLLHGSAASVKRFATRIGLGDYADSGDHIAHSFRILLLDENGVANKALDAWHTDVSRLF